MFAIGAQVMVDGRDAARVVGVYPRGSSSYLFAHYKLDIRGGDRNVAVAMTRVLVAPAPRIPRREMRHYDALLVEAKRVGWPQRFHEDLSKHDRESLSRVDPSVPFLWVLRECGTCLYLASVDSIDGVGNKAWHAPEFIRQSFGADRCRFYIWDGYALVHYTSAEAVAEAVREIAHTRTADSTQQAAE